MSGTVSLSSTTPTIMYQSGSILCSGTHAGNEYKIYFLSGSIADTVAEYQGDVIDVSNGV